jgi:hypothetical protein
VLREQYCQMLQTLTLLRYFPKDPPTRIFINVPAWNGGFDIEVDCIAAVD